MTCRPPARPSSNSTSPSSRRIAMSDSLIAPHGDALVNRVAPESERSALAATAAALPSVRLTAAQLSDLLCLSTGVFSPLTGFVGKDDYESVLTRMRLA